MLQLFVFLIILFFSVLGAVFVALLLRAITGLPGRFSPSLRLNLTKAAELRLFCCLTAVVTLSIMTCVFCWPLERRVYTSPDGNRTVTVASYNNLEIEKYRLKATLRNHATSKTEGELSLQIRNVFLGFDDTIDWSSINVVWADDGHSARVEFAEMNTAYLLPSGKEVYPLSSLQAANTDD